jgi:hypothetical protein
MEKPKEYISPEKNRPFVSYFGVLETNRNNYAKHVEAMQFLFDVIHYVLPYYYADVSGKLAGKLQKIGCMGTRGGGRKKEVFFSDGNQVITCINLDKLREASFELLISGSNPSNGGSLEESQQIIKSAKKDFRIESDVEDLIALIDRSAPQNNGRTIRRIAEKVGRNEPCPCGSGQKFKKCCMGD